MVEWRGRNGQMAEMATYVLFTVHTNTDTNDNNDDDDDDDDNDTFIFYSININLHCLIVFRFCQ